MRLRAGSRPEAGLEQPRSGSCPCAGRKSARPEPVSSRAERESGWGRFSSLLPRSLIDGEACSLIDGHHRGCVMPVRIEMATA